MSEHHCDVVTLDGINNISVGTELGWGRWCSPRQKSLVPDSPFRKNRTGPPCLRALTPPTPRLTRSNAYTLELLKETSERSDFSINPGVGFGLAEAHH